MIIRRVQISRRVRILFLLTAALLTILALRSMHGPVTADSGSRTVMGTFARIVVVAEEEETAEAAVENGFEEIFRVEGLMSSYIPDSDTGRVNAHAFDSPVQVSAETFEVIERSIEFAKITDGAFDITVGPLIDLFKEAEKKQIMPSQQQIEEAKSATGFEKIILDRDNLTIKFSADRMRLDLGGIAKGFAIDQAIRAIMKLPVSGAMVDIGGDIMSMGLTADGRNWRIGLEDPGHPSGPLEIPENLMVLELTNMAVTTSGDYRRFSLIGQTRINHIIDSSAGLGANKLSSVTIIAGNAADADALATAVTVMGKEKGMKLIEGLPDTEAVIITPEFEITKSSGMGRFITP